MPVRAIPVPEGAEADSLRPFVRDISVVQTAHLASGMYDRIALQIEEFQAELNDEEEVGMCLAHFGREILIRVHDVGYHNPHLMVIYGVDDGTGHEVRLLQHLSQLSLLLRVLRVKPGQAANRIGFTREDDSDDDAG